MSHPESAPTDPIDAAAALWLARRDRGLSPAEQDAYLQWLHADPRHTEAVTRHAAALERMMQLYEWQPAHDTEPNPDLFLPRPGLASKAGKPVLSRGRWIGTIGLAAAAALVVGSLVLQPGAIPPLKPAQPPKSYLHVNERLALPDGSRVELKDGTRVVVQYSETERRVKLVGGEAHFSVWKDANRPFIVDAAGVEVRAVGTAFNVRLDEGSVEVLVTEGRVNVAATPEQISGGLERLPVISQGERTVVTLDRTEGAPPAVPVPVTAAEINQTLAWQAPWLQFRETPLAEAVAEFNRLNRHQLVISDPQLAREPIGGTFRPDNVEGFVRALTVTLGLQAEPDGENRTRLRRAR